MHSSDSYFSSKVDHYYRQGTAGGVKSQKFILSRWVPAFHTTPQLASQTKHLFVARFSAPTLREKL